MAIKLKKKPVAEVSVTHKTEGKVTSEKVEQPEVDVTKTYGGDGISASDVEGAAPVDTLVPFTPYCEVGFEASYTHNLGNYESARVVVSLKIPCQHGEIDEAFNYAKDWVDGKLNAVNSELTGDSN